MRPGADQWRPSIPRCFTAVWCPMGERLEEGPGSGTRCVDAGRDAVAHCVEQLDYRFGDASYRTAADEQPGVGAGPRVAAERLAFGAGPKVLVFVAGGSLAGSESSGASLRLTL